MKRLLSLLLLSVGIAGLIIALVVKLTPLPDDETSVSGSEDANVADVDQVDVVATSLELPSTPRKAPVQQLQEEMRLAAKQTTESFPKDPASWHVAALVESVLLQSEKAEEYWRKSLSMSPKHIGPYMGLAELLMSNGRFQEAIDVMKLVYAQKGQSAELDLKMVEAYEGLGAFDEAKKVLDKSIGLYPQNSDIVFALGRVELQEGKLLEAENLIRRSIAQGGESKAKLTALVSVLMRLEKKEEASTLRESVKRLNDAEVKTSSSSFQEDYDLALSGHACRTFENCANVFFENRAYQQAEQFYLKAIQQNPTDMPTWIGLSETLLRERKFGDLVAIMKRIVDLQPKDIVHRLNLAAAAMRIADFKLAEDTLNEAAKLEPDADLVKVAIAKLFLATNRAKEANALVTELAKKHPSKAVFLLLAATYDAVNDPGSAELARQQAQMYRE